MKWQTSVADSAHADYVNNNPGAFSNAFFEFRSVRVFQQINSRKAGPS
jgi:hypothetical protein